MTKHLGILIFFLITEVKASNRFLSDFPCSDYGKYCISSGIRVIEGFEVYRDCWEWAYTKKCNYPSKNDCAKHKKCYSLGQRDCILRDKYGNCVNIKKEFSCKRWTPTYTESEKVRYGLEDKDGEETILCEEIPCLDGNCIDKSYEMSEDMISSVSKLKAISSAKNTKAGFKIFEGVSGHCSKKPVGYQSCCKVFPKGWGQKLGAKCTADEEILSQKRQSNLCVYVGKVKSNIIGVVTSNEHHFCCFSNILEKTIQVQARTQLGLDFGKGNHPNCRGLTLEELARVDFSKIDFSEVVAEIQKKMIIPDISDVKDRINDSFKNSNNFDSKHESDPKNKAAGVNTRCEYEN